MAAPTLSPALDGKYELVGILPGEVELPDLGKIDLRTCTLEQANNFVVTGRFPYLKRIKDKVVDK
jgi:hypothetical protein